MINFVLGEIRFCKHPWIVLTLCLSQLAAMKKTVNAIRNGTIICMDYINHLLTTYIIDISRILPDWLKVFPHRMHNTKINQLVRSSVTLFIIPKYCLWAWMRPLHSIHTDIPNGRIGQKWTCKWDYIAASF